MKIFILLISLLFAAVVHAELSFQALPLQALHEILAKAPDRDFTNIEYNAQANLNHVAYSAYQITPLNTVSRLTRYTTREVMPGRDFQTQTGLPNATGNGIGYGGIISLAYIKTGKLAHYPNFYHYFFIYHISNIKGHLFPLQVGNQIKFHYQANEQDHDQYHVQQVQGEMQYKVVKVLHYQHIPGEVFEIKFLQSKNGNKLGLKNIYYFSPTLGWYVMAEYFSNNKLLVRYDTKIWS